MIDERISGAPRAQSQVHPAIGRLHDRYSWKAKPPWLPERPQRSFSSRSPREETGRIHLARQFLLDGRAREDLDAPAGSLWLSLHRRKPSKPLELDAVRGVERILVLLASAARAHTPHIHAHVFGYKDTPAIDGTFFLIKILWNVRMTFVPTVLRLAALAA